MSMDGVLDGVSAVGNLDRAALLEDWVTIWQSELAGLVLDREIRDQLLRAVDGWAAQSRAMARMMAPGVVGGGHDGGGEAGSGRAGARQAGARQAGARRAGPDAAAGAASAVAAFDERDRIIAGLLERVAELERRLGAASASGGG